MDLGRLDGTGPSKQDNLQDGAGCQIAGPSTLDGIDPETGMVWCQIQANVGPEAFLVRGIESVGGAWEVPVLVKVTMAPMTAGEYDLTYDYDLAAPGGPGTPSASIRGIVGLRVVHPTQIEPLAVVAPAGMHTGTGNITGAYPPVAP